jgi:hypothetical protein
MRLDLNVDRLLVLIGLAGVAVRAFVRGTRDDDEWVD